jgi:succinyl-diaminopimelate desuccinylase
LPDAHVVKYFYRSPAIVDRNNPFVRVLTESVSRFLDTEAISVGRDGASDAICFIDAGVPAVEFGPKGAGHHGPAEWLSIPSLPQYRQSLIAFVRLIPKRLGKQHLRIA